MSFSDLPPEICEQILSQLPVASLLSFGATSHAAHYAATASLRTLSLGVFHSRISGLVSSLDDFEDGDGPTKTVRMLLPKRDARSRRHVVRNQNRVAAEVLPKYASSLRDLELVLWELEAPVCDVLRTMPNLRRLSMRFDHPHTRHTKVEKSYWETSPRSTIWNFLCTTDGRFPSTTPMFGRLEALKLERSGITDFQLEQILRCNPRIVDLRLQKCLTLTEETFEFLARGGSGTREDDGSGVVITSRLKTLHFTKSNNGEIDERILKYISKLISLKNLSFRGCNNLDPNQIKQLNTEEWHISNLTLPFTPDSPLLRPVSPSSDPAILEVNPAYK
ncbi:MAG: hypothetical protein M4579_000831 [Chaenotheca gracillima]|nr:MAG: hypothetical protein M4579_000831 [Chaenotheca gracillima]